MDVTPPCTGHFVLLFMVMVLLFITNEVYSSPGRPSEDPLRPVRCARARYDEGVSPVRKPDRRRRGGRGGAAAAAEAGKMIMDELVDVKGELN